MVSLRHFLLKSWNQRYLFLMVLPGFLIVLVFSYFPMYGIQIAFKKYSAMQGIWGSDWVGLKYFIMFFNDPTALRVLKNTLLLGIYSLLWAFPAPIILALLFNEIKNSIFKKVVQTISYLPHFISTVIIVGIIRTFTEREGLFNKIVSLFGVDPIVFLSEPSWFRTIFISTNIWQGIGFGTILFLAALSSVDPTLYDVANIDGASRWRKVLNINWPHIKPTTIILLIFSVSGILGTDFQKVLLLYSPDTYEVADVIGTFIYREGIIGARFEYTTAIGLFQSLIAFILLIVTNLISRKVSETSLW
ncbi:ABC transporter permease subunit [Paenibacillus sp. JCM 10914]|uniref:ABC transporter permease n=1 Tax=Paenibacillus sp. JCM 10914 TaxID=1236974 RepID=UPI0003CC858C|nr:ABC transporter permease subunit [Paenibacillus sp. JCM 10914]GAE08022.1 ABC-type polysaccharide transport system, permease component [Paenibacillus sp. JCM 10914]